MIKMEDWKRKKEEEEKPEREKEKERKRKYFFNGRGERNLIKYYYFFSSHEQCTSIYRCAL